MRARTNERLKNHAVNQAMNSATIYEQTDNEVPVLCGGQLHFSGSSSLRLFGAKHVATIGYRVMRFKANYWTPFLGCEIITVSHDMNLIYRFVLWKGRLGDTNLQAARFILQEQ